MEQDKERQRLLTIAGAAGSFSRCPRTTGCRRCGSVPMDWSPWSPRSGRSGDVLMVAYADREALERTLSTGLRPLLQPLPEDPVAQRRDLRPRAAGGRDPAGLRRGHGAVPGGADRAGVPHGNPDLLLGRPAAAGRAARPRRGGSGRAPADPAGRHHRGPGGGAARRAPTPRSCSITGVSKVSQKVGEEAVELVVAANARGRRPRRRRSGGPALPSAGVVAGSRRPAGRRAARARAPNQVSRVVPHGIRPSPHPQRVFPARRGQPDPRSGRARQAAGHGQPRGHRPRQPARGLELLRGGQGPADPADPRLRGVSRLRPAAGAGEAAVGAGARTATWSCSRRTARATRTWSGSPRSASPRGSTAGRGSTRTCWRSTAEGIVCLAACLSGEVAHSAPAGALRGGEEERRVVRADVRHRRLLARDPAARHPARSGSSRRACSGWARSSASASSPPTTRTISAGKTPRRTTCCSRSAPGAISTIPSGSASPARNRT